MTEDVIAIGAGTAAIGVVGWMPLAIKLVMKARRRSPEQIREAEDRWVPWGVGLTGLALACFGLAVSGLWGAPLGAAGAVLVVFSGALWKDVQTGAWQRLRRRARREIEEEAERRKGQG